MSKFSTRQALAATAVVIEHYGYVSIAKATETNTQSTMERVHAVLEDIMHGALPALKIELRHDVCADAVMEFFRTYTPASSFGATVKDVLSKSSVTVEQLKIVVAAHDILRRAASTNADLCDRYSGRVTYPLVVTPIEGLHIGAIGDVRRFTVTVESVKPRGSVSRRGRVDPKKFLEAAGRRLRGEPEPAPTPRYAPPSPTPRYAPPAPPSTPSAPSPAAHSWSPPAPATAPAAPATAVAPPPAPAPTPTARPEPIAHAWASEPIKVAEVSEDTFAIQNSIAAAIDAAKARKAARKPPVRVQLVEEE